MLAVSPASLSVGDVIRFIDGPLAPVNCTAGEGGAECRLRGNCAFLELWERAQKAVEEVYDSTSLQDLLEQEQAAKAVVNYAI